MALARSRRRQPDDAQRRPRRRAVAAGAAALVLAAATHLLPARAQTPGTAVPTTPVAIALNPLVPAGQSVGALTLGAQTLSVVVTNTSSASLVNQQAVIRLPSPPSFIASVSDGVSNVGAIDNRTGQWFHTIALIPPNGQVVYTVSWQALCPGLWPIAARVGDRSSSIKAAWIGTPNPQCSPDEIASPQGSAYYALPWPPSVTTTGLASPTGAAVPAPTSAVPTLGPTTTATIVLPGGATAVIVPPGGAPTTTSTSATPATAPPTLLSVGGTTTIVVRPVLPGPASSAPAGSGAGATAPTTRPAANASATPSVAPAIGTPITPTPLGSAPTGSVPGLVSLGSATTAPTGGAGASGTPAGSGTAGVSTPGASTAGAGTSANGGGTATTTATTRRATTTTKKLPTTGEVLCRTVGGVRYCAAKSSVYKEGQKRATEVAPKKTTKTTKKKR